MKKLPELIENQQLKELPKSNRDQQLRRLRNYKK